MTPKWSSFSPMSGVVIMVFRLVNSLLRHPEAVWRFIRLSLGLESGPYMRHQEVDNYLIAILSIYETADKIEKGKILNHAELVTKRSRKRLIKRLKELKENNGLRIKKGSGRPLVYSRSELIPYIKFLWVQMEKISAKRMSAAMPDWLPKYKDCPAHLKLQLSKMSASTLGRYLKDIRSSDTASKGLSCTSPARYMKNKIPINTLDAKIKRPGYTQTDTVAHCGNSAAGPFASSLTVTDIFTTWTENRAMLTKKGVKVVKQFRDIERALPFKLVAINSDSGSEFLNKSMLEFTHYGNRVEFTRSRPYKKNDNCYVEQKNFTHVRELFGYERFEEEHLVDLMNEIYKDYWNPLQNFFLPTFKIKEKIRVGAQIKKKYDTPKTPYQRVLDSGVLNSYEKKVFMEKKAQLNPFELKAGLEVKLKEFFEIYRKTNIREVA